MTDRLRREGSSSHGLKRRCVMIENPSTFRSQVDGDDTDDGLGQHMQVCIPFLPFDDELFKLGISLNTDDTL